MSFGGVALVSRTTQCLSETDRADLMQIPGFGDSSRWRSESEPSRTCLTAVNQRWQPYVLLAALGAMQALGTPAHCLLKQNFRACVFP